MGFASPQASRIKPNGQNGVKARKRKQQDLLALFVDVEGVLLLETGTAVTLFLTCDMDLFCAFAALSTRRIRSGSSRDRRVLTFPSGWLLVGEIDSKLLVSLGIGRLWCFGVPVCRGKDAEGDRDAGFKVQRGGLCVNARERIFSYNLP